MKTHTTITLDCEAWLNAINIIGRGKVSSFLNNILLELSTEKKSNDIKLEMEKVLEQEAKIKLQKQILVAELENQKQKETEEKTKMEEEQKEMELNKSKCKYCGEFINGKSRKRYSTEFSMICLDCVKSSKEAREEVGLKWIDGKSLCSTTVKERDY